MNPSTQDVIDEPDETSEFEEPGRKVGPPSDISPDEIFTTEEAQTFVQAMLEGSREKTVDVLGHTVVIRTVTVDEELEMAVLIKKWEDTRGYPRAFKTAVCSGSIVTIDGKVLYMPINPTENVMARKFNELKSYYPIFIDAVYAEVLVLEQEVGGAIQKRLGKSDG